MGVIEILGDIREEIERHPMSSAEAQAGALRAGYSLALHNQSPVWECKLVDEEPDIGDTIKRVKRFSLLNDEELKEARDTLTRQVKLLKRELRHRHADAHSAWLRKNMEDWHEKKVEKVERNINVGYDIPIKINGVETTSWLKYLKVISILQKAAYYQKITGVDEDKLDNYVVMRVGGKKDGKTYASPERQVRIREGDEFIAIYRGKTAVA